MSSRTIEITDALQTYLRDVTLREDDILRDLRQETAKHPRAEMQISPEQGQFMTLLANLGNARTALEIGTFTGYSAICVARALPADGKLICCDVSPEYTDIARRYWQRAELASRIDLRIAPALETLGELRASGAEATFDFIFVDADKENSDAYYEHSLALLRPGGLFLNDNALCGGKVTAPETDSSAAEIDALNRKVIADTRVDASLIPIGDGLLLARKQ